MFLPLFLLIIAVVSGGVVAFGTHPSWGQYGGGVDVIIAARRMQWPLVALSIVCCVAVIGLVISGRRRAWWLIGLAPVLAMFVHKFVKDPYKQLLVLDQPAFVSADVAAQALSDDAPVVGLQFAGSAYAYPVASLDAAPVIVQAAHDKRMLLLWSPAAGRATAAAVERQVKARDLEIVSAPAGALLVYDGRLGQFVNAVTGQTPKRQKPVGFTAPITTTRTTWKRWRAANPESQVMTAPSRGGGTARPLPPAPLPLSVQRDLPADARVIVVNARQPIALIPVNIGAAPLNLRVGESAILVFRDTRTGEVRAFDRRVEDDLIPTFRPNTDPKRKGAAFFDPDTGSGWDLHGEAVSGRKEFKGRRLAPLQVEENMPWGVMKYWYPEMELVKP